MCGSKLKFTSSCHPQADPAERAIHQVMEALQAAVATVAQYDELCSGKMVAQKSEKWFLKNEFPCGP